tara:strand:- start:328 stop:1020 length:693 start_codon:yes stop_codon:yes gene_type:complete
MLPNLSSDRITAALAEAKDPNRHPSYQYPWPQLDLISEDKQDGFIWVLGYGSLLSKASAARTIETSERALRLPVIAPGARRRFSYRIPQQFLAERYKVTDGTQYSALDCDVTYNPDDLLNGILTRLFLKDLDAFRQREYAYDLKPIPVFEWEDIDAPHRIVYILDCPPVGSTKDHPFATDIPPQTDYYKICREGAKAVSESFLDAFLDSTYLGDGKTSVRKWEKESGILS